MPSQKITLHEVAARAGVSITTVSFVLNDNPRISDATRQRVLAAMDELGYVYNQRAASLRTNRSYTIGLVIVDIANPFYAELTAGIEESLQAQGYSLLLGTTLDRLDHQERLMRTMRQRDVDGAILVPAVGTSATLLNNLREHIPLVLVARYLPDVAVDYVGIDNERGAREAVEHLVQCGHRRIAFIGGNVDSSARQDRVAGYRRVLATHDIYADPALNITANVSREGGYAAATSLLALTDPPTAALCYNDVVAFGAMLGLRAAGIEPGRDFAVIGFDDVSEASLWNPPLATVAANPVELGRQAANLLIERISHPELPIQQMILPGNLILRASGNIFPPMNL